jgi:hypothetical protein
MFVPSLLSIALLGAIKPSCLTGGKGLINGEPRAWCYCIVVHIPILAGTGADARVLVNTGG